jgi:hypothetical protein
LSPELLKAFALSFAQLPLLECKTEMSDCVRTQTGRGSDEERIDDRIRRVIELGEKDFSNVLGETRVFVTEVSLGVIGQLLDGMSELREDEPDRLWAELRSADVCAPRGRPPLFVTIGLREDVDQVLLGPHGVEIEQVWDAFSDDGVDGAV